MALPASTLSAEAEFVGVSQVLVYVGAISTLITFAIMLTRGMMYGATSPRNRQSGTAAIITVLAFVVLAALMQAVPWPQAGEAIPDGEAIIARIGSMPLSTNMSWRLSCWLCCCW